MNENLEETIGKNDRFQNIIKTLTKCKIDILTEKDEYKKLKEYNAKLEVELKEAREQEKSHRYHLLASREMIGNLQETVSQLVYLKRDVKKLKEEMCAKDSTIIALEKEKDVAIQKHKGEVNDLKSSEDKRLEELSILHDRQIQELRHEADTQIAQFTCAIEELRSKMKEMEIEHRDKMNVVVLEYEEKLQRSGAQVNQLQDQLARQSARTDANIDAYRRRLEELEEKLKQSEFKQYLAQSHTTYESHVERPYSVDRDYPEASIDSNLVPEVQRPTCNIYQNKAPKQSTLQVMYYGNTNTTPNNTKNEKKGQFNISKKRKLYSDKADF